MQEAPKNKYHGLLADRPKSVFQKSVNTPIKRKVFGGFFGNHCLCLWWERGRK
jgi:hypothetical protein